MTIGGEVTITRKEYEELLQAQDKLSALEAAGVDNWEGYCDAMEILYGMQSEFDV